MHKPNKLLEADVFEELDWDPRVDDTRIVVAADDGRVTLSGSVPTYFQAKRAEDDARLVGGVKGVDNQLHVGLLGDALADADIAVAAKAALDADRFVPNGSVTADVLEGWVTMRGEVRHHYQRQAAEHAISRVDGVLGITDDVTLTTEPLPGDVAERIEKAFQRNAIIDDTKIEVTNDGPTIYLDGRVGSWAARREAEDTAWTAPGVRNVIDRTTVTT